MSLLIVTKSYGVDAPKNIEFPDTVISQKRSFVFSLQSAADVPFTIESAVCDHPNFSVSVKQSESHSKQHWIEALFQPSNEGEQKSTLLLKTSHSDAEEIKIDMQGTATNSKE